MPSASTQPPSRSTASTSRKALTSSRRRAAPIRSLNKFEVSFARPTAPLPSLSCAARASFFEVCGFGFVEEVPGHRVAGHGDVALGEHDLEEMRVAGGRAEHLGAAVEVHAPDAPEALVEALGIERAHALPVAVEALAPGIQRKRVVPAHVLDVEHLQAAALHLDDHFGEARDPAAGKDVLADEEVGVQAPDMPDEVQHAQAAVLEVAGVGLDDLGELVAPGVLQAADRGHLVELAPGVAEVGVHLQR